MVWAAAIAQIKKRDGRIVEFDRAKIANAILKAAQAVQGRDINRAEELADRVVELVAAEAAGKLPTVEAIQDTIEKVLIEQGHARTAKAFILYRARRSRIREGKTELMDAVEDILAAEQPQVAGSGLPAARLIAIGAAASREYYLNRYLPEALADAHLAGTLHVHGLAHYAKSPHAVVIPFAKLLGRGFMSGHAHMRAPRRPDSAAALTGLLLQAAQADAYGGLVLARFESDLASVLPESTSVEAIAQAMEALVHQLNALPTPAVGQLPRVTLQVGLDTSPLGRAVTGALLAAVGRGLGRGEAPLRPHVVYLLEAGVNAQPGDPNYDLTRQAAELATRSLALTFADGEAEAGLAGHEGRLFTDSGPVAGACQVARVTLNLPRVAMQAQREGVDFWAALEGAFGLAVDQLKHRFEGLAARTVADYPFLMGQHLITGAEGLKPTDAVRPALAAGTLGVGLVGLAETLVVLTGQHHGESADSQALGLAIIQTLAGHAATHSSATGLRIVLQGSDAAGLGDRMARLDRRAFGLLRNVTETPSYTSGIAVPAAFPLTVADRLAIEGAYARFMPGGCLTTVALEAPPSPDNLLAWLGELRTSGQQALALTFPRALCQACGGDSLPESECARCEAPPTLQRRILRRRGYLELGE